TESDFEYHLLAPIHTKKQEEQIIKYDQLSTLKNPFTKEMVASRITSGQSLIAKFEPLRIVTGSNVTIFLSARNNKI
ncbi:glycosyltransferase, partial [Enterococcus faecium]